MEKTFIDNYLLKNYDECLAYFKIGGNLSHKSYLTFTFIAIEKLNPLEQCFLIDILVKQDRPEDAKRVLGNMQNRLAVFESNDRNQYNRVFDTVLNLNMQKPENA